MSMTKPHDIPQTVEIPGSTFPLGQAVNSALEEPSIAADGREAVATTT
jgi:hypothetical protein